MILPCQLLMLRVAKVSIPGKALHNLKIPRPVNIVSPYTRPSGKHHILVIGIMIACEEKLDVEEADEGNRIGERIAYT